MATPLDFKTSKIRHTICEVIYALKNDQIDVNRATAIALVVKELNNNVATEIAASKWAAKAAELGHDFGKVNRMGELVIGEIADEPASAS